MSNVNYTLPDQLGTLAFSVPSTWDGARAQGIDAAWIDQRSTGFKDNVTLKIHSVKKTDNPSSLLDHYFETLLENTGVTPTTSMTKTPARRDVSVQNEVKGHTLNQDATVIYAENDSKAYLVCLSSTHINHTGRVDLSTAEIIQ